MKLIVRAFVLGIFACGASAAVVSLHSTQTMAAMTASHQAVASAMPIPACGPDGCAKSAK
jgi:hypothetical protein